MKTNYSNNLSYLNNLEYNSQPKNFIMHISDLNTRKVHEINFDLPELSTEWKIWCMQIMLHKCGGYSNVEKRIISAKKSSITLWKRASQNIAVWASRNCSNLPLTQWRESQCRNFVRDLLVKKINFDSYLLPRKKSNHESKIYSRGPVEQAFNILLQSRSLFQLGKISQGITLKLPNNFLECSLSDLLESNGTSYESWKKGDSYKSIPFPIAMTLLSEAITILRKPSTKLLQSFFEHQNSDMKVSPSSIFYTDFFNKYCNNKFVNFQAKRDKYEALKLNLEQTTNKKIKKFPYKTHTEINNLCHEIYDACIVIFLTLTGIRVSELVSINADDYKKETDGTWVFKSKLHKTNFGLSEVRTMSGLVAEAADLLVSLSYVQKSNRDDNHKFPIFGRYFFLSDFHRKDPQAKSNTSVTGTCIRFRLAIIHDAFVEKFGNVFEDIPVVFNPHQFRHSFAEFSIRRFDGNVIEAIRQHFRHSAGSFYTHRYTDNKLSPEIIKSIEDSYVEELLERMISDEENTDFTGPVAVFIKKQAKNLNYKDPREVDDFVTKTLKEFSQIIPHEYGLCLIHRNTSHLSKCLDKKTQIPKVLNGCFELCSGCPNSLHSTKSNKESIIRNVISHENFIENYPIRNTTAHKISKKVVSAGYKILRNMDKSDEQIN